MEREVLEALIAEGLSQSEIGRRLGRHQSTVAYWVQKHGLTSSAFANGPRGEHTRDIYAELVGRHMTVREMAAELGRSPTTVRYWLERYGLRTTSTARMHARRVTAPREHFEAECRSHGATRFVRYADGTSACLRCRAAAVTDWRRCVKRRLVERAGGACALCGYDRCVAALQFHHRDPSTKRFAIGGRGLARAWDLLVAEADTCELLCSNCHAEVEAGVATLP